VARLARDDLSVLGVQRVQGVDVQGCKPSRYSFSLSKYMRARLIALSAWLRVKTARCKEVQMLCSDAE